jgi:hypothetical protein
MGNNEKPQANDLLSSKKINTEQQRCKHQTKALVLPELLYSLLEGKSCRNYSLQIDRIDNSKGYTDDNVGVVNKLCNMKKRQGKDFFAK